MILILILIPIALAITALTYLIIKSANRHVPLAEKLARDLDDYKSIAYY